MAGYDVDDYDDGDLSEPIVELEQKPGKDELDIEDEETDEEEED